MSASRVQLLPDHLVNQIAAGEVIERPASVLKELIENALDAGASHLIIHLREGGKEEISITDDGAGLPKEDLGLALQRHATSKISSLEDLQQLSSYGFRGEALPSIASVSMFVLTTRFGQGQDAWEIRQDGGELEGPVPGAHPPGTTVQVRHLFHRVPGRRKFLKATSTELKHCVEALQHFALLSPKVSFTLTHDGNPLLDLPQRETLKERVQDLYGNKLAESLEPFSAKRKAGFVEGLISPTHQHFSSRNRIQTFVNRRPVIDRVVNGAIMAAYKHALPRGRFPAVFIFLEVPPELLDVNVHPAKREVRFKDQKAVYALISEELEKVLYQVKRVVDLSLQNPGAMAVQHRIAEAEQDFLRDHRNAPSFPKPNLVTVSRPQAGGASPSTESPPLIASGLADKFSSSGASCFRGQVVNSKVGGLMVLGQLYNTFILAQDEAGLLLVDQHVAHERILYEGYRKAKPNKTLRNALLTPLLLDYGVGEGQEIAKHIPELLRVGLEVEAFGPSQWRVLSYPAHLPAKLVEQYARECLDLILQERGTEATLTEEKLLIMAACRSAVMANKPLKKDEMETLLEDLFSTAAPLTCPHGRPGVLRLGFQDLLKYFTRP